MVAYDQDDETVVSGDNATHARIAMVSEDFWDLSGAQPAFGRLPARGERGTLLLSHGFFERWFQSDVNVIGKPVMLEGRQVTITGVLPKGFRFQFPSPTWPGFEIRDLDGYRTVVVQATDRARVQLFNVVAKLKPNITIERARVELETIRARIAQGHPTFLRNQAALRVVPLQEQLVGEARLALWVLLAAVVFLLLIACANIANLLLGRAPARQKEIAIRASVGAGRARLLRQLLVESLVLALLGGAAGLLLARWGLAMILTLIPQAVPRLAESTIDGRVLAFTFAVSCLTVFLFGIGSAITLWKVNLHIVLKAGARTSSAAFRSPPLGTLLVAVELAMAVVLLTGAGLMVKSLWRLNAHPYGFDPEHILVIKVQFSGPQYRDRSQQSTYADEFLRRVHAVPGVSAASLSTHGDSLTVVFVEGALPLPPEEVRRRSSTMLNSTSAGFAPAMGMRVLKGRWITDADSSAAAVINETLARRDFPSQDPVGKRIRIGDPQAPFTTIVGVVGDLKYSKLDASPNQRSTFPTPAGALSGSQASFGPRVIRWRPHRRFRRSSPPSTGRSRSTM